MELECVYVVKRSAFVDELALPTGYAGLDAPQRQQLLALFEQRGFFVERRAAEQDPDLKQLIPYCVVHDGSAILCVRRLKQSSEGRLHGSWSIGIGGHIEPQDRLPTRQASDHEDNVKATRVGSASIREAESMVEHIVTRAARRELQEELLLSSPSEAQFVGWINDDSNPVGQVHLGLVHLLRLDDATVAIRETDRLQGGMIPLATILALRESNQPFPPSGGHHHGESEACDTDRSSTRSPNEPRSFPTLLPPPASLNEPVPRDWNSIESWSRFVLEAIRPRNHAFSLA